MGNGKDGIVGRRIGNLTSKVRHIYTRGNQHLSREGGNTVQLRSLVNTVGVDVSTEQWIKIK